MGNRCCTWCARVCCCCCPCCQEEQPLLKGMRRPSEEQPILTVLQDPTGNSEIQEMKFKLHSDNTSEDWEPLAGGGVGRTEGKDSAPTSPQHKPLGSNGSSEEVTSPSRTFVRGGTGKASWRLTPTPKPSEGGDGGRETGSATVTFQDSHTTQEEPQDFVLMSQELEGAELGEMQVSKSFTISFQGITEN